MDTLFYEGFFERDSLLEHDSLLFHRPGNYWAEQWGMSTEFMPETLFRNDGISLFLIFGFLLLVVLVLSRRHSFSEQVSNFFYPQSFQSKAVTSSEHAIQELKLCLLAVIASLFAGVLVYFYAHSHWNLWLIPLSSLQLLGIYSGICFLFLILKQLLLRFVNAVFFTKVKRQLWRQAYAFLFRIESVLLLPVALLAVFLGLSYETVTWGLLILLFFVKSLVLIKDFTYFFDKNYCLLHLFVYFCTLEAAPLLVLWAVLGRLTNYMTTIL